MSEDHLRLERRWLGATVLAGLACVAAICGASPVALAAGAPVSAAPRLLAPEAIPSALLVAAQAMEGTRVTSERFSIRTAVSSAGARLPREVERFLKLLFDTHISGEATVSPPAGSFQLTLFGRTLTLRVVGGHAYIFDPAAARRDGGRPWIDLGGGGLAALFGAPGQPTPSSSGAPETFSRLAAALRSARAVRELGSGSIDGQAVTGYRLVVPSGSLQAERVRVPRPRGILGGVFGGARPATAPPDENMVLEVFVDAAGVPVRAHSSLTSEGFSFSALTDVYAIDFPLVVARPPRKQTIGVAVLSRLARKRGSARRRK